MIYRFFNFKKIFYFVIWIFNNKRIYNVILEIKNNEINVEN